MPRQIHAILAVATMSLLAFLSSCRYGKGSASEIADSTYALYHNGASAEIRAYADYVRSEYDYPDRSEAYACFGDSPMAIRAFALVVTHKATEMADSIMAGHNVILSNAVNNCMISLGDTALRSAFKAAITQRFDAMDVEEKARWIIAAIPPEEITKYIKDDDRELIQAISALYSPTQRKTFASALRNAGIHISNSTI